MRDTNTKAGRVEDMRTVNFEKLKVGELVEVPRYQFAPMRHGWNGWLFSEAVVIRKGIGKKSGKKVVVVEMRVPKSRNNYGTIEKTFYPECVFKTKNAEIAKRILEKDGITNKGEFYKFIEMEDVTGCDWIRFLIDKGFIF